MSQQVLIALLGFGGVFIAQFFALLRDLKLKNIADSTHSIVNNERTLMLLLIANLSRRVALDNPDDEAAQSASKLATDEANKASGK